VLENDPRRRGYIEKLEHGTRWNKMERDGRSSIGRAWRGADSTKLKLQISQERNE